MSNLGQFVKGMFSFFCDFYPFILVFLDVFCTKAVRIKTVINLSEPWMRAVIK